jgi:biotin carboxylase
MPRRLLVLGAGPAQLGLLRAARARGLFVIACDADPLAPGFAHSDRRALVSTEDEVGIDRLARALEVDGIVSPGSDWPVAIAARVAHRLGLPHPLSPEVAALSVSKPRQREVLVAAGVPVPEHERAASLAEAAAAADALGYPCVVKAPDRQGQRGLTLVRTRDELDDALAAALAASRAGTVLVEEHVEGPELTVNALSNDGVFTPFTVTDRLTAEDPAFGVALSHVWPSEHDTSTAVEIARAAVEAVGVRNGPSYTQLRLGPDGPVVMEVAARLGGGHDAELCRAALGVDLNALAVAAALGTVPSGDSPRAHTRAAAVVFLVPPAGTLAGVDGVAEAEALDGVDWVRVYRRPGHVFGPFRRGADRAGAVLATGGDRDEALTRARRAADAVRFRVDADAP